LFLYYFNHSEIELASFSFLEPEPHQNAAFSLLHKPKERIWYPDFRIFLPEAGAVFK
jgi:hypothetical protein